MNEKPFTVHNKISLLNRFISKEDVVLDVGFWGQGIKNDNPRWPHKLLKDRAKTVYGIDIEYDESSILKSDSHLYQKAMAENFSFDVKFDVIFAGDLIEHLVNPGLFLDNAKKHLKEGGRLIMTTPNTFSLFNIAGKMTRFEPIVNSDHTFYFNNKTLKTLLEKCNLSVKEFGYMYTLEYEIKESYKKKILNVIYKIVSLFTPKYYETLIVVAVAKK